MKREIKDHKDINRRIGHYINGEIPVDDDGPQIYIIEGAYEMNMEDEGLVYISFLSRREGTKSHGQIDWEIVSYDKDKSKHSEMFYNIMKDSIEKNNKEYQWLD